MNITTCVVQHKSVFPLRVILVLLKFITSTWEPAENPALMLRGMNKKRDHMIITHASIHVNDFRGVHARYVKHQG